GAWAAKIRLLLDRRSRVQLAAINLDKAYFAEPQRRNTLQGGVADLSTLRQEQSARFTPQAIPPPLLCT
ncbi:MAG TPA: hypothetical protein VGO86_09600, partial [Candidatus Dormibacteraeota bacterium]